MLISLQQILLAVSTIHEERIVHSDLKPANFLLVRGSLKLIDFGIAKAIMSDTTNIQRDSQVRLPFQCKLVFSGSAVCSCLLITVKKKVLSLFPFE